MIVSAAVYMVYALYHVYDCECYWVHGLCSLIVAPWLRVLLSAWSRLSMIVCTTRYMVYALIMLFLCVSA